MRSSLTGSGVLVMAAAALCVVACHGATTSAPAQRGPRQARYGVGFTTLDLTDDSRITPENGTSPQRQGRHLPTVVWYPAKADFSVKETEDAYADPRGAPFPLVVFVHGSTGFNRQSTFLMDALAAHGYVVAAADFPLTALTTTPGPTDRHVELQVGDVSFIADQIYQHAATKNDELEGLVSASDGFAVTGHSTGGTVSLVTAFGAKNHDDRVKAAVALAPCACFFAEPFFKNRVVPLMVIAGTNDRYVPPATNGFRAFQLAGAPKRLVTLIGGTHIFFTDIALDESGGNPTVNDSDIAVAFRGEGFTDACSPVPPFGSDPPMLFDDQHAITTQLTQAFLDAHLYGDGTALQQLDAKADTRYTLKSQ